MIVLILLVVPIQMGFERLFERCAAALAQYGSRHARRKNVRKTFQKEK